jgi:hypothetical protein
MFCLGGPFFFLAAVPFALQPEPQEPAPSILLPERTTELPEWAADNAKRRDPGFDQWRTEVLHSSAKPVILPFFQALLEDSPRVEAYVHPSFTGIQGIRPAELELLFDDGAIQVHRATSKSILAMQGQATASAAQGMLSFYKETDDLHPSLKLTQVWLRGDKHFTTRVVLHLSAHQGAAILQTNMEWDVDWVIGASDDDVAIQEVRVLFYEEIRGSGRIFGDVTGATLSDIPFFKAEILRGTGEYQYKTDRLIGNSFIGAQGIAIGDADGDGREDIYICQQGGLPNRLYTHKKDGTVMDSTKFSKTGFLDNTRSALFVDLDNDKDQDLAFSVGANLLIAWNNGRGLFTDLTPLNGPGSEDIYSISSADADGDGDLDLYAARYVANGLIGGVPTPYHDADNGASNIFWRNEGNHQFIDATEAAGFSMNNGKFSLASLWEDFDDDGDMDLYVTNDFGKNNFFINEGGVFVDRATELHAEDLAAGMGITVADTDLDGDLDLYVSNMFSAAGQRIVPQSAKFMSGENQDVHKHYERHARGNSLMIRNEDGTYSDVTMDARVAVGGWAWGARFMDINNDGLEDIYVPNGFVTNKDPDDL